MNKLGNSSRLFMVYNRSPLPGGFVLSVFVAVGGLFVKFSDLIGSVVEVELIELILGRWPPLLEC